MTEAEIRADERAKCSAWLAAYAHQYVDKWTGITPDAEDDHKATGWNLLVASKRMLEQPATPPATDGSGLIASWTNCTSGTPADKHSGEKS